MKISTHSIVSTSDMIKNYKVCRSKAEEFGKVFIMKNNKLDAVLSSIANYERFSDVIEHLESLKFYPDNRKTTDLVRDIVKNNKSPK